MRGFVQSTFDEPVDPSVLDALVEAAMCIVDDDRDMTLTCEEMGLPSTIGTDCPTCGGYGWHRIGCEMGGA